MVWCAGPSITSYRVPLSYCTPLSLPLETGLLTGLLRSVSFSPLSNIPTLSSSWECIRTPPTNQTALLMELMDESLTTFLSRYSLNSPVPLHTQVNICHDVSLALHYLHINNIIHRDLSSNNVLLLGGRRAKITDFGMSKLTPNSSPLSSMTQVPGCPVYMPPEAWVTPPMYTNKLDIFSMGVIMVQLVTCKMPNPGPMEELIPDERSPTGYLKLPVSEVGRRSEDISLIPSGHPLHETAIGCLSDRPEPRPTAKELCQLFDTLKVSQQYIESSEMVAMVTYQPQCICDRYCEIHGERTKQSASTNDTQQSDALRRVVDERESEIKQLGMSLDAATERIKVLESDNLEQSSIIKRLREQLQNLKPSTKTKKEQPSEPDHVEIKGLCREILSVMKRTTPMYHMTYNIDEGSVIVSIPDADNEEQYKLVVQNIFQVYQHMFNSGQVRIDFLPIPAAFPSTLLPKLMANAAAYHHSSVFQIMETASMVKIVSSTPEDHEKSVRFVSERLNLRISLGDGRTFVIKKGNLVNEECSIIVSAANPNLSHRWGVSAAINVASQFEVQKHCNEYLQTHPMVNTGEIAHTKAGGNLKCKWIIHAVGPSGLLRDDKHTNKEHKQEIIDCMKELVHKILHRAEELQATSIAIPAISTGSIMLPPSIAATGIIKNIMDYKFSSSSSLTDVRLVILRQDILEVFIEELLYPSEPMLGTSRSPLVTKKTSSTTTAINSCKSQ